ncbi:hypothetical protein [Tsukamurella paurometabola]|uniref:HEPN AbiU2-like domain-containing protein n=1 Tax=Tsukamurella paurometabola TaxID=2061 RepID=A0ABS5NJU6_TSUPA|nr:hypothetical protein [Tsukamurella paurometabola]MBS4104178.1 hypothetical protein [Tsukamurella paurometabola]
MGYSEEEIASDQWKAERAEKELSAGFPTLHAHALLGLWGAFERFIEDVFVAMVVDSPEVLEGNWFAKLKLPLRIALSQGEERARAILLEVARTTGADSKSGVNQFENVLDYVGLDGATPKNVSDAVYRAQQIRHVWAHRGGVADAQFVSKCPDRASVGDKLMIDIAEFLTYMHGLHMYGWVIVNRHLVKIGEPAVLNECAGYKGTWAEFGLTNSPIASGKGDTKPASADGQ